MVPVIITVYQDRSFSLQFKSPPASVLLKKEAGLAKGSGVPNKNKVGKVTKAQLLKIVEMKKADLNTDDPGRRGIRSAGGNLELDDSLDLLSHFFPSLSARPPGIPTGADGPQNQRLFLRLGQHVLFGHLVGPALGSAGAATGIVKELAEAGSVTAHDIAVFTSMCMCWSGYLSTHASMMQSLKRPDLTGKAIASHTIGGLAAGVAANWLFKLFALIF